MRKSIISICLIGLLAVTGCGGTAKTAGAAGGAAAKPAAKTATAAQNNAGLSQLHVSGVNLADASGKTVVLHGMSTHGMQWFSQFANAGAFRSLKNRGANIVRLAMYTDEGGYLSNPAVKDKVYQAADAALAQNLYVLLDWHILHDGNPRTNENAAAAFFKETAQRYGKNPGVLYEICNEPNGNVTWDGDIRPYAEHIIGVIRAAAPQSVIIVGTPTWSQEVDKAAAHPLTQPNVMYACHFYAGTHTQWLRDRIDQARSAGAPIFISEWGTSAADGNGGVFLDSSRQWLQFLSQRQISWCNWSLCDKNEASAALRPGASPQGSWQDSDLSASGQFVFSQF